VHVAVARDESDEAGKLAAVDVAGHHVTEAVEAVRGEVAVHPAP
jgi:hypothetical protein